MKSFFCRYLLCFRRENVKAASIAGNFPSVKYCPLHTAEYATGLSLFDWLYTLWHGMKDDILDGYVNPATS